MIDAWMLEKFDGDAEAVQHALNEMSVIDALREIQRREEARRQAKFKRNATRRVRALLEKGTPRGELPSHLSVNQRRYWREIVEELAA